MISIFAKHPYLLGDEQSGLFLQRVSSRIRAEEIAEYLGAKLNPKEGYENDVCIYVKPQHLDHIKEGSYVDLLDDLHAFKCVKDRPDIKVIAMSLSHFEFLKQELKNEVILIPHHHVNYERILRDRKEITTCGYVGVNTARHRSINHKVKRAIRKIDLEFTPLFLFQTRQDILDYYKNIDIQVIGYFDYQDVPYYHPTKIINAASFGIPTVAGKRLGYKEIEDFYIPVSNMDELVAEVEKLKNPKYYNLWSEKVAKMAEKYHISKIAKLYQQLVKDLITSTIGMKKTVSTLVDELSVTNIKIFMLVDKIQKNEHTKEDAKKLQDLNSYRAELCNAINREFDQRQIVKI